MDLDRLFLERSPTFEDILDAMEVADYRGACAGSDGDDDELGIDGPIDDETRELLEKICAMPAGMPQA